MRILYVNHEKNLGGASRCLISIMEAAKKCGHEVYCLTPFQEGDFVDKCKEMNINVIVKRFFMCVSKRSKPCILEILGICFLAYIYNFFIALSVAKKVKNEKIEVIHTNSSVINIGCMIAKLTKVKQIMHIREYVYEDFNWSFIPNRKTVLHYYDRCCSDVIFISNTLKETLESYFSRTNVLQIYDGIDIAEVDDSFHNINKIGIVGRILEGKGQIQAIQAIEILVNKYDIPSLKLYVVGSGNVEYEKKLKQYVIDNRLEKHVCFVGYRNDVNIFRRQFGIELFCSNAEGFGRVVIEAMLSGNIVIASDRGAFTEIIDNKNVGYLYAYGNCNILADKIYHCLNNNDNYNMRNAARKMVIEKYSEKNNTDKILSVYNNVVMG